MHWCVDASFVVHNDMKSHTGAMMTFGQGAAMSILTKQKLNAKSSTEAELAGVDDSSPFNVWCMHFLKEQGCHASKGGHHEGKMSLGWKNVLCQDNTSSIKLETNGKASSTKRTRHVNIRHLLIVDKSKKKEIDTVEHFLTEQMVADCFTKPL